MTDYRYRAVLAANWHFPEDANLTDLNGPRHDVEQLRRTLTAEPAGLFRPEDVTTVTDRPAHEICGAMERLLGDAGSEDVVLLYYSGHGFTDRWGSLRLAGRGSVLGRVAGALGTEEISQLIARTAAAATIVLLDCCHAGAFKGGDLTTELGGKGRFVLAASSAKQRAPDAAEPGGMSPFTECLVRGMRGEAAPPGAAFINVVDLYQFVNRTMEADGQIRPQWRADGQGGPNLARAPGPPPARRTVLDVLRDHADAVPGMVIEPAGRSRTERRVRKLGGVSDRESTMAVVQLPGAAAVLFTDLAVYWLTAERGVTAAMAYPGLPARRFSAVVTPGVGPTHVDLGDGIPQYAGPAAGALAGLLGDLGRVPVSR